MTLPAHYERAFQNARLAETGSTATEEWPLGGPGPPLTVPWEVRDGRLRDISNFWFRTLGYRDYSAVSPERAWRAQIPLKIAHTARVEVGNGHHRVAVEALCHPLANSVAVSQLLNGEYTPAAAAGLVASVERGVRYRVTDRPGGPWYGLRRFGPELLTRLDRARRGVRACEPGYSPDPFVLVTVVQGSGNADECRVVDGGEVHRLLEALATRGTLDEVERPGSPADRAIDGRAHRGGGMLYGDDRARVVWAPYRFLATGRCRWLGCYHRNLTLSTALTDAWLGVAAWGAEALRQGRLPVGGDELVERAARLLGFVCGTGGKSNVVYRSRSAAAQIRDSGLESEIGQIRKYSGISENLSSTIIKPAKKDRPAGPKDTRGHREKHR